MSGDPSTSRPGPKGDGPRTDPVRGTEPWGDTDAASSARPAVKDPPRHDGTAHPASSSTRTDGAPVGGGPSGTARRPTSTGPLPRATAPRPDLPSEVPPESSAAWGGGTSAPRGIPRTTPADLKVALPGVDGAVVTAAAQPGAGAVRKARLTVSQLDPWSVMKMSFLLSLAGGIVLIVAVWLLWLLLSNGDVFVSVDRTVGDITGSGSTISVMEIFSLRRVMGIALMLAVVQVVLVTALATLGAFLYNLSAGLVGGFEVTLAEDA